MQDLIESTKKEICYLEINPKIPYQHWNQQIFAILHETILVYIKGTCLVFYLDRQPTLCHMPYYNLFSA
jgi:hypothetical protein